MKHSSKSRFKLLAWVAASALAIVIAGCQSSPPIDEEIHNTSVNTVDILRNNEADSPQKTYLNNNNDDNQAEDPIKNNADNSSHSTAETSSMQQHKNGKDEPNNTNSEVNWHTVKPLLYGIAIGDSDSKVRKLYGNEDSSYTLTEENENIEVLEYNGFSVGLDKKKTVMFVEVYSKDIAAGLSGLRIGDHPKQALETLGSPETQTDFLLTYEAKGALLKLDLDPKNNEIVAIKLLSES